MKQQKPKTKIKPAEFWHLQMFFLWSLVMQGRNWKEAPVPHALCVTFWIHIPSLIGLIMVVIRSVLRFPFLHLCLMRQWFKAEFLVRCQVLWDLASDTIEFQNLLSLHLQAFRFFLYDDLSLIWTSRKPTDCRVEKKWHAWFLDFSVIKENADVWC